MDAKKCDRCGKFFNKQDEDGVFVGGHIMLFPFTAWIAEKADIAADLCPECRTDFERWIKNVENT